MAGDSGMGEIKHKYHFGEWPEMPWKKKYKTAEELPEEMAHGVWLVYFLRLVLLVALGYILGRIH